MTDDRGYIQAAVGEERESCYKRPQMDLNKLGDKRECNTIAGIQRKQRKSKRKRNKQEASQWRVKKMKVMAVTK